MIFTSSDFLIFFAIVFGLYHLLGRVRIQNILILAASCIFYAWWSWKFLFLMLGLSVTGYLTGVMLGKTTGGQRRSVLILALSVTLFSLFFFKYFGFLFESISFLLRLCGGNAPEFPFTVVLPIAISFHTFQLIAYVVDVYRGEYPPEYDFLDFMAFSFFFPQLIAGPIERAEALLTQFKKPRVVTRGALRQGFFLVSYGFFVKLVLADTAAPIVNSLFVSSQVSGWSTVFGTILFGFQIYFDFLGYSLIAKGLAALLGFSLVWNFNLPYWASSPADFWRRWHISLSRWLRDYLYIPLGGNRGSAFKTQRNLIITMVLGGLWHGASWNFALWGLWHGVVLAAHRVISHLRVPSHWVISAFGWTATMVCVFIGWYLFRVTDLKVWHATFSSLANWEWFPVHTTLVRAMLCFLSVTLCLEVFQRRDLGFVQTLEERPILCGILTGAFAFFALCFHSKTEYSFIYFAF